MTGSASLEHEESKSETTGNIKTGQTKDVKYDGTTTNITDASQNITNNSGSINTSKTDASQNTTVIGPSTSKTTNTSSTSDQINTSQLLLTKEATDYMVKGILEGTNGLAAVSSGQKAAGAYNTSGNTLLVNDLLARTAGEVAARSAITKTVIGGVTTTNNSVTENSGSTTTQNIGATNATQVIGGSSSVTSIGGTKTTQTATGGSKEDILTNTDSKSNTESQTTKAAVKVGWILCTELWLQGRMPMKHYVYGSRVFASYGPAAKRGYYIWAVPALAHLRAHPFSYRSKLMCSLLNARAEYLAAEAGLSSANKTVLGFIAKNLYWGCVLLGHTVARDAPAIYEEVTSNG